MVTPACKRCCLISLSWPTVGAAPLENHIERIERLKGESVGVIGEIE